MPGHAVRTCILANVLRSRRASCNAWDTRLARLHQRPITRFAARHAAVTCWLSGQRACRWRIWSADCRANFARSSTSRSPCRPPARVCTSGASARTRTRAGYQRRPLRDRPRLLQNLKARAQEQERESHVQTSAAALAHGNARRCGGGGRVRVQLAAVSPALRHAIASSASRAAGGESETAIVR